MSNQLNLRSAPGDLNIHKREDNFWKKNQYYQRLYEKGRERSRVFLDAGSDGVADMEINGGSVRLRRD